MTIDEVVQNTSVIIGTLLIHSTPIIVLFDSRCMHMFISRTFINRIRVPVDDLGYDMVVSTPVGVVLTIGECMKGITIVI